MDFELTEQKSQHEESDEEQEEKPREKNEFGLFDEDELENTESI